jgi:D-glutamate cyclase
VPAFADPIDHLLALDPGGRGIGGFFVQGGALAAATALQRARRVLIVTGFVVGEGASETDGPPGAAVLGRALRRLGTDVRYVTDAVTRPLLAATLSVLEEPADVLVYPDGPAAARRVLADVKPSHLVAIERPGRCRSGDYLNARGLSVAAWNPPLDDLFLQRAPRLVTIGVGDGGNEIGMGNVRTRIVRQGELMARIVATVKVNHLVVAGVSNWGAYGIVAQLARLVGTPLLHTPTLERRMIEACAAAGGHDGLTRRREPTVDGLPLDTHAAMVELLGVSWKRPGGRSA